MAAVSTPIIRRISGTGILRMPDEAISARRIIINADIIRPPKTKYENYSSEPPESFYAKICLMKGSYLHSTFDYKFESQEWIFTPDEAGQILIAIKCAYDGILETFFNLGNALELPSISLNNTIKDYLQLPLPWDAIKVKCYADTALQLSMKSIPYDVCKPEYKNTQPPGEPPTQPTKVPPGTPVSISTAYDNTDTTTQKHPIDDGYVPTPCITVIRGSGFNPSTCGPLNNFGDYSYNGYAELEFTTVGNCMGLQVFVNGVSLGTDQIYHGSAIILSRTGDCTAP